MNLADVIESLVEERGLNREQVIEVVCDGVRAAYEKKFPEFEFSIVFNKKTLAIEVFVKKTVVSSAEDKDHQISLRKAQAFNLKAQLDDILDVPFEEKIGRIEILAARQIIARHIRKLEQDAVYEEFKDRQGTIVTGTIHKKERSGFAISLGEVIGFMPFSCTIPGETLRVGYSTRALLKEVLADSQGGYQLIFDRASADFVKKLIETEIPEVFEGIVEVKKVVRIAGYKTKIALQSNSKEIDPVGTCVGIGGARIKPILRSLDQEKIDLIAWTDNIKELVKSSLKPAEVDDVEISEDERRATVHVADDQRSFAIGKGGQNIALASQMAGIIIQLQGADIDQNGQHDKKNKLFAQSADDVEDATEDVIENETVTTNHEQLEDTDTHFDE